MVAVPDILFAQSCALQTTMVRRPWIAKTSSMADRYCLISAYLLNDHLTLPVSRIPYLLDCSDGRLVVQSLEDSLPIKYVAVLIH